MRASIYLFGISLIALAGCQISQQEDQSQAFLGKWYHQGFEIDGEPIPDDTASSPFFEFEASGEMHAYKFPNAPGSDERGWFEVVGPNQLRLIGDGDGGKENGTPDEGEIASAILLQWEVDNDVMRMSTNMGDQTMTIIFRRGWPGSIPER